LYLISINFPSIFIYLFTWSIFGVMDFWIMLSGSLRTERRVILWTVLELVGHKIWLSFEYKSCSLFNVDVCRIFICYHHHCGIKVMMVLSSSIVVVLFVMVTVLPAIGLGHRNILLIVCFMCVVVLVLRITYGQVVLLWTLLNFVAWQLKKASKYSTVVYTLSLVIWITSI
jgi:hypothetical protein